MNKLNKILEQDKKMLSIYFTAGFPKLDDTQKILLELDKSAVDFIEVGLPFSDPLADGKTIQESSKIALDNGMNTKLLFKQLQSVKDQIETPLVIMGYFNPILQYGVEQFCKDCQEAGVSGCIIPDLPPEEYNELYKTTFRTYGLVNVFLITPQSPDERIRFIDEISDSFIYMVSSNSITGARDKFSEEQMDYFERVSVMSLKSDLIVGFGISNQTTFKQATQLTKGAIVGSAFINHLNSFGISEIDRFVNRLLG
jgi:tryptophan synthase alpha chain